MDIHHVKYFLAVCKTLNFTRAAELAHVTQPALSRAVQQLESELGGSLFLRERNATSITEFGAMMRPRLQAIMDEISVMRNEVDRFLTLEEAHFTLGVLRSVGPARLAGFLSQFRLNNPGIKLRLVEGMPEDLNARLEAGAIDVAIMARADDYPARFELRSLYQERYLIAFSIDHRFSNMQEVPLSAIDGENYLNRTNCEFGRHFVDCLEQLECEVLVRFASDREDWILNMVAGGLGVCCVPEFSALIPGILARPVIEPEVWREVCMVTVAGRRLSPALVSFTKAIKGYPWPKSRYAKQQAAA